MINGQGRLFSDFESLREPSAELIGRAGAYVEADTNIAENPEINYLSVANGQDNERCAQSDSTLERIFIRAKQLTRLGVIVGRYAGPLIARETQLSKFAKQLQHEYEDAFLLPPDSLDLVVGITDGGWKRSCAEYAYELLAHQEDPQIGPSVYY